MNNVQSFFYIIYIYIHNLTKSNVHVPPQHIPYVTTSVVF